VPNSVMDLASEQQLGLRAHYLSGWLDLDTALARIQVGGFETLTRERAAEILSVPLTVEQVKAHTRRDVSEEQITARLAEVKA
jgi:hypothetical protein